MPSGANASKTASLPEEASDQRYRELIRSQERLRLLLEITNHVVSKLDLPDLP